jgi:hypothetical protein
MKNMTVETILPFTMEKVPALREKKERKISLKRRKRKYDG